MRPPRRMKASEENLLTGMMGALPKRPPYSTMSPTSLPGTGMMRTAVVLLFITPTAISSAMIAAMVSAEVEPGTATMSMPTEQTLVHASSLSNESAPTCAAFIIASSSLTGMNAPRGLAPDEFARARELERELLYKLGHLVERSPGGRVSDCVVDDAGAGDSDVYDGLGLADAVERAGHERIVL